MFSKPTSCREVVQEEKTRVLQSHFLTTIAWLRLIKFALWATQVPLRFPGVMLEIEQPVETVAK